MVKQGSVKGIKAVRAGGQGLPHKSSLQLLLATAGSQDLQVRCPELFETRPCPLFEGGSDSGLDLLIGWLLRARSGSDTL